MRKTHLKNKTGLNWFMPGRPDHKSWVNQVLPGFCSSRSFALPGPVQSLGQPDPRSTCQAGPDLGSTHQTSSGLIRML
jgi:hypothetical protein